MSARGTPNGAEHPAPERRERERSCRAGLRDELLHPDRVREHPGLDRRAGHRGGHRRRPHQHGDQERHATAFSGSALQTYQGQRTRADNVDEELRAAGLRPDANSTELITNTNFQLGGPLLEEQDVLLRRRSTTRPTHVKVAGFPAVVPSVHRDAARGHERPGHHRHPCRRRKDHLSAGLRQPLRGLPVEAALRQAESRRRRATTQDSESKELDTFVITQIVLQPGPDRPHVPRREGQLQQHALPAVSEDRSAAADRQHQRACCTATATAARSCSAAACRRSRTCSTTSGASGGRHEFKAGFDNGYTPEDVDTLRVDDVNLTFRSAGGTPRAAHGDDLQHAAAPGARGDDHRFLRPGLV